jgi:hypothetical protein
MANLLALQDPIAATPSHPGDVEQFCSIDHMIV